jgi:hypothetical protein
MTVPKFVGAVNEVSTVEIVTDEMRGVVAKTGFKAII